MTQLMLPIGPMDDYPPHRVYVGNRTRGGNNSLVFGRCRCGAVLEGQDEIDAHRLLEGDQ